MGYLSCKAQSSISVSNSHSSSPQRKHKTDTVNHEARIKIEEFEYADLQRATDNFSSRNLLGKGSHAFVYKAVLRSGRIVAVKKPSRRRTATPTTHTRPPCEFDNELHILPKLQSPRFVNLIGCTSDSTNSLLVFELMPNGTLYDMLHKNPKPPNWGRRLRLALQTAKAIETLHSMHPPVIHRDIKSANILIDKHQDARLADFGLALRCHVDKNRRLPLTPPAGTIGYIDPLYVTPDNLSTKTDVFSFGILLLEIISGRKAIDVGHSPPSIIDWAIPLIRKEKHLLTFDLRVPPPKDPVISKQLAVIAAKCVRSCYDRRPSMKEVVKALDGLTKLVPLNSWNGLANQCLMVDTVVNPVVSESALQHQSSARMRGFECGNLQDVESNFLRTMKNSKRVYSDLGVRNNLKELLAKPHDDGDEGSRSNPGSEGLSIRIASERKADRAVVQIERNLPSRGKFDS